MSSDNDHRTSFERKHLQLKRPNASSVLRRRLLSCLLTIGLMGSLLFMTEQPARAYVDPGSGFLALQLLGAWLTGTFFILRHKLKALATRRSAPPFQNAASPVAPHSQNQEPIANLTGQDQI